MRLLYAFLIIAILAPLTSADAITDINLWVGVDGNTRVEEKIVIDQTGATAAQIALPKYVSDLNIADDLSGKLTYSIIPKEGYDILNFTFKEIQADSERNVLVKYGTPHLTKKDGVNWTISYQTTTTPRRTIVRVNFPVGASFLFLKPDKLLRSYDKYAVLIFPQEDFLDFDCAYKYAGSGGQAVNASANESIIVKPAEYGVLTPSNIVIIIVSIVFIFGIIFVVLRMELFKKEIKEVKEERKDEPITVSVQKGEDVLTGPKIVGDSLSYDIEGVAGKKGRRKVKDSVLKMLEDNEMAVVKILEGSGEDEVTQANVHKITGIPKSSLSDIIKRLEKRNILETTSQGRIKWLKIQKWVLE